jgi:hypothetical protein
MRARGGFGRRSAGGPHGPQWQGFALPRRHFLPFGAGKGFANAMNRVTMQSELVGG